MIEGVGVILVPDSSTQHVCSELAFTVTEFQAPPIHKTLSSSAAEVSEGSPWRQQMLQFTGFFSGAGEKSLMGLAGGADREMAFFSI